jgi:hypothetical protein
MAIPLGEQAMRCFDVPDEFSQDELGIGAGGLERVDFHNPDFRAVYFHS